MFTGFVQSYDSYSMSSSSNRFVRFNDQHSGLLSLSPPLHPISQNDQNNNLVAPSFFRLFSEAYDKSSTALRRLRGSKTRLADFSAKKKMRKSCFGNFLLDPQGAFLQKWNKIYLFVSLVAVAVDPLFFYIPVYDDKQDCLNMDHKLKVAACALRTLTDLFYLLHIILRFRTGFISRCSRVMGRGELIRDPYEIAKRYVCSSSFWIDVLAVLPLPQVVVLLHFSRTKTWSPALTKDLLEIVIFCQYVPRLIRVFLLYKEVTRNSGIIIQTAWAGAAFNLFLYIIASHAVGAFWYLFAVDRQHKCWSRECGLKQGCHPDQLYCNGSTRPTITFPACIANKPDDLVDPTHFDYGIALPALSSIVKSTDFPEKLLYCFWWGLKNLSSCGQNLQTSPFYGENLFSAFICLFGLVLFALLIGNMQKYLESTTVRVEEMRVKRRDTEQWMSHRLLPESLRGRVRRYEQYKWQETRGVDEEGLIRNLPKDLKRDIKRHLCLNLLMRVPMFKKMDEQLIDAMCHRLKPVLYTDGSSILREGDPVDEMLFIMRGRLVTMTTNGGRTGFFNSVYLVEGDFCGEELLTWALDPRSSSNLPISTRTVLSKTAVEAFALLPDDFKFVASQFRRRLHSKQLRHAFRFYSQQWRNWAACFLQAAWRQHARRKADKALGERENELKDALAKEGGSSVSLGATIYASRFAANALRSIHRNVGSKPRLVQRLPSLLNLQKPAEPDFSFEEE